VITLLGFNVLKIPNHIKVFKISLLCIWRKCDTCTATDMHADRGVNNKGTEKFLCSIKHA
jgi:hypothetical protein